MQSQLKKKKISIFKVQVKNWNDVCWIVWKDSEHTEKHTTAQSLAMESDAIVSKTQL